MIFSRGRLPDNVQFLFRGQQLDIVNDFYYLDVELSRTGNCKNANQGNVEKATRTL